jgi:hypothetical protein
LVARLSLLSSKKVDSDTVVMCRRRRSHLSSWSTKVSSFINKDLLLSDQPFPSAPELFYVASPMNAAEMKEALECGRTGKSKATAVTSLTSRHSDGV